MKIEKSKTYYRKDYRPSSYLIDKTNLEFHLHPRSTIVKATTTLYKNNEVEGEGRSLELTGDGLKLISVKLDDELLGEDEYEVNGDSLIIKEVPDRFVLQVETEIAPDENKALSGLYRSSGNYCTQCEAEGFRRITYFLDRPDVLAKYTTKIIADKNDNPILLANGNLIEKGEAGNGKHYAIWQDPYPKPSYLFALVAGNLVSIEDTFTTKSGREVDLQIYVEERNIDKCDHAMISLKKAMKWDEEVYGLEYDLDIYMIVAVDDFNMGAMENKGLNVFNSKYVLASSKSATDQDFLGIEGVIAHEYFHNWTGNRVTCRDWFQLSLKEGLTVFRDQQFSADMNSHPVKRINDVKILRTHQFREDASPMSHPVRPDSYEEINNFYTMTVYNKGAEVIRMMHRLVGKDNFRKGMDLYFQRFDGMAVTCDDFVQAIADGANRDLEQFKLWYSQSGTPLISVSEEWDEKEKVYSISIAQSCPPTPGQGNKQPFHLPIDLGLVVPQVRDGEYVGIQSEKKEFIELKEESIRLEYKDFQQKPIASILRGFSAPVKLKMEQSREELGFLMAYDSDLFNRWDSAYKMSTEVILEVIEDLKNKRVPELDAVYLSSFKSCLLGEEDDGLTGLAITLPADTYIAQQMQEIDPELIDRALTFVRKNLATELRNEFLSTYERTRGAEKYSLSNEEIGKRNLKNVCLSYLMTPEVDDEALKICHEQFVAKRNMTDVIGALSCFSHIDNEVKQEVFDQFYQEWKTDPLVIDKWLALQSISRLDGTLERVKGLLDHEAFSFDNPNKVRSLIGAFCSLNHGRFHHESGAGYRFLSEMVLKIDKNNPQIAARLVTPLISFALYKQKLKVQMQEQLRFIMMKKNISKDLFEIVSKSIGEN